MLIYADLLFILNFATDYLILLCTAMLSGHSPPRLRLALGALVGAAYSAAVLYPALYFMRSGAVKLSAAAVMVLICFGGQPHFFRTLAVFAAAAFSFGGALYAVSLCGVSMSFAALCAVFAISLAAVSLFFRRSAQTAADCVDVAVEKSGRALKFRALTDTGNLLRDPVSGSCVIVAEASAAAALFDGGTRDAVLMLAKKGAPEALCQSAAPLFRLIPYSAVGGGGMLAAFRPDKITINGKVKKDTLVALSPYSLSDNGTYSAVIGAR